jgi:hypothetical protein
VLICTNHIASDAKAGPINKEMQRSDLEHTSAENKVRTSPIEVMPVRNDICETKINISIIASALYQIDWIVWNRSSRSLSKPWRRDYSPFFLRLQASARPGVIAEEWLCSWVIKHAYFSYCQSATKTSTL